MNIVITMGGLGSRFIKAGYNIPKYKIEVNLKTLFEWSMKSLKDFFSERFIFVVKKEDNSKSFIMEKCQNLGISNYYIREIDYLTKGQAETALLAEKFWNSDEGLLIYNIDTYIEEYKLNLKDIKGDGFIPCFVGDGTHWSFVRVNNNNQAIEVREKEKISDNCSVGAYYFSSAELYKTLYNMYYGDILNNDIFKEEYIAPMYNLLIKLNKKVYIQLIDKKYVHVLGTPEEVEVFKEVNI